MNSSFQAVVPSVGIFWLVETTVGTAHWLTAGCSLEAAEPFGDFLTFDDGHYDVWEGWRQTKDLAATVRALVRSYEYEDWPRGRIVYDRSKKRFTLYADTALRVDDRSRLSRQSTIRRASADHGTSVPIWARFPNAISQGSSITSVASRTPGGAELAVWARAGP
jgi:hypothetical protein